MLGPDFNPLGAFMRGLQFGLEHIAWVTGAGIVFGLWLFVAAVLLGHSINWLIEKTGSS